MKKTRKLTQKNILRYAMQGIILGILATTLVVFYTIEVETIEQLAHFRWRISFVLIGLIIIAWLCNGCRIMILSRSLGYNLSYRQSIAISLSSEFGIAATPAGMGGAIIRLALLRRAGVPIAHGTSMLATDVALDSLFFSLLFPFALYSIFRNPKILALFQSIEWGIVLILLLGISALLLLLAKFHFIRHVSFFVIHWTFLGRYRLPARYRFLKWKLANGWRQMKEGLYRLFSMRKSAVLITFLLASFQWTCRYSILPLVLYALSIPNDPVLLFMLQGLLFLTSMLLVLPGGGGGVEVSTALILKLIIPHPVIGIVILIWRICTYHLYLLGGGITFFTTCARLNTLFPQSLPAEEEEEISFNENGENHS
jgi:uncharacterized protein (TIRG00374 family)